MLSKFAKVVHPFRFKQGFVPKSIKARRFHVHNRYLASASSLVDYTTSNVVRPSFRPSPPTNYEQPNHSTISNQQRYNTKTSVTIVESIPEAQRVLKILQAHPEAIWACDTEVSGINLKEEGPVGHGKVICISIYGGNHIDFGSGSTLWIENINAASEVLQVFKDWFEDARYRKVWHNYGFDRHVMENEGIVCKGFYGDTMHMARLWDTSRDKATGKGEGYSLAALTELFFSEDPRFIKTSMIELFGVAKEKKDGSLGKKKELPDLEELQSSPLYRSDWIEYSARDAVATWHVREMLEEQLEKMPWLVDGRKLGTMKEFYSAYLRDFGDLLTDMEANGIKVDTDNHLKEAEKRAREEREKMEKTFLAWATELCPATQDNINIASTTQIQQLLFGHYEDFQLISSERIFQCDKSEEEIAKEKEEILTRNPYALQTAVELKQLCKARGIKGSGKKPDLMERLLDFDRDPDKFRRQALVANNGNDKSVAATKKTTTKTTKNGGIMDYPAMKVDTLKELIRSREITLSFKGKKKADLIAALEAYDAAVTVPDPTTTAATPTIIVYDNPSERGEEVLPEEYTILTNDELASWLAYRGLSSAAVVTVSMEQQAVEEEEVLKERYIEVLTRYDTIVERLMSSSITTIEELTRLCVDYGMIQGGERAMVVRQLAPLMVLRNQDQQQDKANQVSSIDQQVEETNTLPVSSSPESPSSSLSTIIDPALINNAGRLKKYRDFTITSIGMTPVEFTATGLPQVSSAVLKKLAGKNLFGEEEEAVWGTAFEVFGGGEAGKRACRAIGALAAVGQVDATINNFLVPLQALVDKNKRIHCSLNLNTETGRLSSRRPNLQNQPALEKDQYKIRDAFVAEEGKTFIVADYGQLELRILAHVTGCQSMIEAFKQGGCFHSRTAVGMYEYIKEAVDSGKVMLEWDYSKGQPTVPLVKDTYASERRKAKTLNFSIAYGKTVHGLALDWGITKEEAEKTLEAWYRDRPEVKEWQLKTQQLAREKGYVRTIMGRYRRLADAAGMGAAAGHALRAAINTPIQGSAADIVMMAMIKLWKSEVLAKLGWKLLLQIHDEVILEGPKERRDEAMQEVRQCMENPFDDFGLSKLLVHLDVDAKSADSWYKAK